MRKLNLSFLLLLLTAMSSCKVIGGIFKAGFAVGIIVVLVVIFIIIWIISAARK